MLTSSPTLGPPTPAPTSPVPPLWRRAERWLPALLVGLAALLRLLRLNLAEYRGDDDDMVTAATQALHQGWLQAHGLISSIPIDNGPIAMWLLMLPLAVTSSLLVAQVWVALLNIGSVALCYHAVRTTWNRPLALVTTALFAVSPWAVIYSRRLWITAFDAPLALVAFWMLLRWLRLARPSVAGTGATAVRFDAVPPMPTDNLIEFPAERLAPSWQRTARRYLPALLCGLAFSAFFQAHVVPMGEVVTLLLVFLLFFRAFGVRRILLCLATLAITIAPYVLTTVLPALGKSVAGQQARHPGVDLQSWYYFGNLVTGRGYQSIAPQGSRLLDATALPFTLLDWLAVGFLVLGSAVTAIGVGRALVARDRHGAAPGAVVLLWALIPPLGLMVHLVEVHPYYFVVSMPAIYILEGAGLLAAATFLARVLPAVQAQALALGVTGLLLASQLLLAVPFFAVIPEVWSGADYGLPLQDTVDLAAAARTFAGNSLAVVGGYDHDVDYTLYSTLGRRFPGARYADDRGILEYAASGPPLLYLTTDDRSWEARTLLQQFAGSMVTTARLPGEGHLYRFFRPSVAAMQTYVRRVAPPFPAPQQFGDAAQLLGAAVRPAAPGDSARVLLNWRLLRDPTQPMVMRLELTGSDGYVWTSTAAVSYPAGYWHNGDAGRLGFLSRIAIPLPSYLPPGGYGVRVRLLGIVDGKQFGPPATAGSLTITPQAALAAATATPPPAPALPHATNVAIAPGLTLVGWGIDRTQVQQNDVLGAVLFWRVTGSVGQAPALRLRAPNGATVASTETSELASALPAAQWPAGALLADRRLLHIDGRATPGAATLTVLSANGQAVALGPLTVVPLTRATVLPPLPFTSGVSFGGVIELAGYALDPPSPKAGASLRVTLSWQAIGLPSSDETVFVHLVDATGKLAAQADAPPGMAAEPTSTWEPGQVVTDIHTIPLPASLPAGAYRLQVGLYNLQTGVRLPASGPGLSSGADHTDLAQHVLIRR